MFFRKWADWFFDYGFCFIMRKEIVMFVLIVIGFSSRLACLLAFRVGVVLWGLGFGGLWAYGIIIVVIAYSFLLKGG